ncbi:hypothetical protein CPB86DRAFT_779686 [Serendipita vermifera]|nr:hypothetical protein CPB86DRAFT_779686 [Serendipita vermifera]
MGKAGRKSDLQERIVRSLRMLQSEGKVDRWQKARAVILQAASGSEFDPETLTRFMSTQQNATPNPTTSQHKYNHAYGSSSASGSYYPTPNRVLPPAISTSRNAAVLTFPTWRPSPFYRIDQPVSNLQECPESTSSSDRRVARFNFYLQPDQLSKLQQPSSKYQLRLYCTTSQYYITLGTSFRHTPCPIEFPPTCEVRVNNHLLTANFRGIKKKAGTAPPADITALTLRGAGNVGNQVEMVYVNSTQTVGNKKPPPQKYYLIVNLVECTSVDQLVDKLRTRVEPKENVIAKMKLQQPEDDEVQAGPTKLALRDPLTYTRLNLPCRARSCVHLQCFDARCWYSMMEQTTTWLCPICDRQLDVNDLIIDGFVSDILKNVDEETDDVMVEPDGEWHTEDGKYGSISWIARFGTKIEKTDNETQIPSPPPSTKPAQSDGTITIGDSEDSEEENEVKRELSPVNPSRLVAPSDGPAVVASGPTVIDLTLDDSDEDQPAPPRPAPPTRAAIAPPNPRKRKLSSDGEHVTGSSRRTSTAASFRSAQFDDDGSYGYPDRPYSGTVLPSHGNFPMPRQSPMSPPVPTTSSTGSSPAMYQYPNGNSLPSPTILSPTTHHGSPQWNSTRSQQPPYALPPASSLLSAASMAPLIPSPQLSSRSSGFLPPPHSSSQIRPQHETDYRSSTQGSNNGFGSATSRYAEWGLRP